MKTELRYYGNCSSSAARLLHCAWRPRPELELLIGRPILQAEKIRRSGNLYQFGTCELCGAVHPVERAIEYSANPSNHACNGQCMSARGPNCECHCGGKNHGAGFAFMSSHQSNLFQN